MADKVAHAPPKRDAVRDKVDVGNTRVVGSGISETTRVSVDLPNNIDGPIQMPAPWTENRAMIVNLFQRLFEQSFQCPGRDHQQCCKAPDGQCSLPNWREREDPEWYAQQINVHLSFVNARIGQQGEFVAALAADEAFALGCLVAEALIKFRWDAHAKRGEKAVEDAKRGGERRREANRRRLSTEDTVAAIDLLLANGKRPMAAYRLVGRAQGVSAQTIGKEYRSTKKPR